MKKKRYYLELIFVLNTLRRNRSGSKETFSGIAVIIDNEVDEKETPIYKIRKNIVNSNIPVVAYNNIPSAKMVESFKNVSFIILDWNFLDEPICEADEALKGLIGASELKKSETRRIN